MNNGPVGEYHLQGVREMASGFLLKPDGTFQFYFIYGALDRYGSGKWLLNEDRLILNSAPKPLSDFTLVSSKNADDVFITVRMEEANPALLRHVYCSLQQGAEGSWHQMSQQGEVRFPRQQVSSVSLVLEFCAERFSEIAVDQPDHNDFLFRFNDTIMEVFFENFSLQIDGEGLSGRHPLMDGESFRYEKR